MFEKVRKNILILDPVRDIGELFARALETRKDCKCYLALAEEDALDLLRDIPFDFILVDLATAMARNFGFLKKIRKLFPAIIVIIDAYLHQKGDIGKALALGAHHYIFKPIKVDTFRKKIDELYNSPESRVL